MRPLLVAGATGLVGREIVGQSLQAGQAVCAVVRRRPPGADPAVQWLVVDFEHLPALPAAHSAFCALGTTIKVAGSRAAFRGVDHDATLAFALAARRAGCTRFGLVSALGANAASANFYSRVKGEAEAAVRQLGFGRLVIARPSLLDGDRAALQQPARPGERLALAVTAPFKALIPRAFRPIDAAVVSRALRRALAGDGPAVQVLESAELQTIGVDNAPQQAGD